MMYQQNGLMPMNQMNAIPQQRQQNGFMNQGMNIPQNLNNSTMQQQYGQQQTNFFAKIVDSIEAVRIADVPMDGNSYIFPKADGSEIYTKRWLPNFTTDVSVYVKAIPGELINVESSESKRGYSSLDKKDLDGMTEDIMDRLSVMMNERLDKMEKSLSQQNNSKQNMNKRGE